MSNELRAVIVKEIADERERQVWGEGYSLEFDERYDAGELAKAASLYAAWSRPGSFEQARRFAEAKSAPIECPWLPRYFKPSSPRRMLVKAAALIIAEIERLDRVSRG